MFHRNCSSIIPSLRDIEIFLQTENDVISISPLGGAVYSSRWRNLKNDNGFLLVLCSNFTSSMHRYRDNDVFLQTGKDVMVIPPLGGAVRSFRRRILKGWPQVYIHALLTYFVYLLPLKSFSTFSFWLGFPYRRPTLWGFRGKMIPKSQNFEKYLHSGHFLASHRVFWAIVRGNRSTGMGCTRG